MQGQAKAPAGLHLVGPNAPSEPAQECTIALNADSLHDLVGAANQMRSMADLILKRHRGQMDGQTVTLFGFLQEASDKLEKLLGGMRTYMRVVGEARPYHHFDANAVLTGALATVQDTVDRSGARITYDRLPEIYGDPNQIGYVFAALAGNAIKFRGDNVPQIHIGAAPDPQGWRFSVADNGIGIDPKNSERVFGVFKRLHNDEYPGAGIGLSIARGVVERHGGRIWVESQLGQGSTFYFTLPAGESA